MAQVLRFDRGEALRRPVMTPQGFLRVDGHVSRAGIYEYRNDDGSTRRELRPDDEVFATKVLEQYASVPITIGHPRDAAGEAVMVSADNVKDYEVGNVEGAARRDGERTAAALIVKDSRAIKSVKAGKQQLSPGYTIDLEETPGVDPKYGRYDAIQRNITINHLAIVDSARGGSSLRLRMDEVDRVDGLARLTNAVDGHQHLIDLDGCRWPGDSSNGQSGSTSWAVSEGADVGHEHPWVRNADGSITIGESAGHTHTILDENRYAAARADQQIDRTTSVQEGGSTMDPKELQARLDELTGENKQLKARISTLEGDLAAGAQAAESEKIKAEKTRADEAEAKVLRFDETFASRVKARVKLEREAGAVMGPEFRLDDMEDRAIYENVVKRLDSSLDVKACSEAELRGHFQALLRLNATNVESQKRVSEILNRQDGGGGPPAPRADTEPTYEELQANAWKTTLKNGRAAAEGR